MSDACVSVATIPLPGERDRRAIGRPGYFPEWLEHRGGRRIKDGLPSGLQVDHGDVEAAADATGAVLAERHVAAVRGEGDLLDLAWVERARRIRAAVGRAGLDARVDERPHAIADLREIEPFALGGDDGQPAAVGRPAQPGGPLRDPAGVRPVDARDPQLERAGARSARPVGDERRLVRPGSGRRRRRRSRRGGRRTIAGGSDLFVNAAAANPAMPPATRSSAATPAYRRRELEFERPPRSDRTPTGAQRAASRPG